MIQIKCPYCGKIMRPIVRDNTYASRIKDTIVKDALAKYPRRRKECVECGKRFNTREIYIPDDISKNKKKRKQYIFNTMVNIPRRYIER